MPRKVIKKNNKQSHQQQSDVEIYDYRKAFIAIFRCEYIEIVSRI